MKVEMKSGKLLCCLLCLALATPCFATPLLSFDVLIFDQYGNISWEHEKARLNQLAKQLNNEPNTVAHIMVYGGKVSCSGEAQARARRAKSYLMNVHGIAFDRVIWRDGGFRERLTVELWIKERGEREPTTISTLMPSDVQIIKSCNRIKRGKL
jgi:hypothetical protein